MRDLINKLLGLETKHIITEGVGLARRKSGDVFKNSEGKTLSFNSLVFYPERGSFTDTAAMDLALEKIQQGLSAPINWTNQQAKNLGFAVAHFTDDAGQDVYLGRYFKLISADRLANNFPHNAIPGGFTFSSKVGEKEHAGYKPSEILSKKFDNLSPSDIFEQIVAKFGENSDESNAFSVFLAARDFPVKIPRGNMNSEAFKQYFCEILQPIAFIKGMTIGGTADAGIAAYIGKTTSLAGASISFNAGATGGLSDSTLTAVNGKVIKISTKEGAGAMASVKNLIDSLREIDSTKYGKTIRKQYPEEIRVIEILEKGTHYTGPLELAKFYNIINDSEMQQVMNVRAKNLGLDDDIIGKELISNRLENWYNELLDARKGSPVIPHHALMFIIANKVCDYVNNRTSFGNAGSDILNHSAVLQVYTSASVSDTHITINGFSADYPGDAVTGIKLTCDKSYWTTGENGKITFKILKNNEKFRKPVAADPEAPKLDTKPKLVEPGTQRVKIRPPKAIARRDTVEKSLGRERRSKS